ncbi:hypothetical protein PF002_g8423 [Phytophthora fragariae]|uniref:Uncharacterized protein n=1 Tax=Phytophthora fragariae TaxID=53985 RepID=A0A6A3ZSK9_9STRA|nr:hypothetical protein PF003_g18224 [Phytophthora fragariae]KAE9243093.1 hypothetical protein PF002_g8423 [Phytophthora fragariae]
MSADRSAPTEMSMSAVGALLSAGTHLSADMVFLLGTLLSLLPRVNPRHSRASVFVLPRYFMSVPNWRGAPSEMRGPARSLTTDTAGGCVVARKRDGGGRCGKGARRPRRGGGEGWQRSGGNTNEKLDF